MSDETPRSAREALLVTLLGESDAILARAENITLQQQELAQSIKDQIQSLKDSATAETDAGIKKINEAMIARTDDFVSVANETMALFSGKAKEIQAVLKVLYTERERGATPPPAPEKKKLIDPLSLLLGAVVLLAGFAIGLFF